MVGNVKISCSFAMSDWRVLGASKSAKREKGKQKFPCQSCGSFRRKTRSLSKASWFSFLKQNIFLKEKNHRFCIDCAKNLDASKLELKIATPEELKEILEVLKYYVLNEVSENVIFDFKTTPQAGLTQVLAYV